MVNSRALRLLPLCWLACIASCTPAAPPPLKKLAEACTTNADCGQMLCLHDKCTELCAQQGDCPVGFDCVLQAADDATAKSGPGPSCAKAAYTNPATGGFGADCALVAPDPKSGDACDPMAKTPCADGFTCHATLHCDPEAFCTKGCTADSDCPPTMFCGVPDATKACTADADCDVLGQTCKKVPGGTAMVCQGASQCLRRTACSPCATDDQCPTGFACGTDINGEKFCGQLCAKDENCPQPSNDSGAVPLSSAIETCVPAFEGAAVTVCRPVVGTCHGKSAIAAITDTNAVCAWCREGFPGDCASGFCYVDSFSKEHFCAQSCTAHIVRGAQAYTVTNDTCPSGSYCFAGTGGCASCDVKGYCAADNAPTGRSDVTVHHALTCYPLMP